MNKVIVVAIGLTLFVMLLVFVLPSLISWLPYGFRHVAEFLLAFVIILIVILGEIFGKSNNDDK